MKKIYIISGERSGDLHASNLVIELKKTIPDVKIRGIGGDYSQNAGVEIFYHYQEISFMGFWEVIKNIFSLNQYIQKTKQDILNFKPDAIILVDFAGFNMRIANFAKQNGIKVIYYISPKIWAWNTNRALKIKNNIDLMLCILPFEKDFYKQFGYDVKYVGNPVLDAINNFSIDTAWENDFLAKDSRKIIAILPGSRKQEVEAVLNEMIQFKNQFTNYRLVVAGVDNLNSDLYKNAVDNEIEVVYSKTYDLLTVAKAAVVTSGTATLETVLFNVPQVVCYKTSTISYLIAKQLIKVKYISLVNLIAEKEVVKELIQDDFNAKNIAFELEKLLSVEKTDEILADYKLLRNKLGDSPASVNSAKYIADFLA